MMSYIYSYATPFHSLPGGGGATINVRCTCRISSSPTPAPLPPLLSVPVRTSLRCFCGEAAAAALAAALVVLVARAPSLRPCCTGTGDGPLLLRGEPAPVLEAADALRLLPALGVRGSGDSD
jgi:hypothetical protein